MSQNQPNLPLIVGLIFGARRDFPSHIYSLTQIRCSFYNQTNQLWHKYTYLLERRRRPSTKGSYQRNQQHRTTRTNYTKLAVSICNPPIYDMTRRLPIIFYTFQPNSVCFWKMCRRFVQPNQNGGTTIYV